MRNAAKYRTIDSNEQEPLIVRDFDEGDENEEKRDQVEDLSGTLAASKNWKSQKDGLKAGPKSIRSYLSKKDFEEIRSIVSQESSRAATLASRRSGSQLRDGKSGS